MIENFSKALRKSPLLHPFLLNQTRKMINSCFVMLHKFGIMNDLKLEKHIVHTYMSWHTHHSMNILVVKLAT